jgi:hypothetical protein
MAAVFPSEGFARVSQALAAAGHGHPPRWLDVAARTAQEAADVLGVTVGQIAKSVIFRRRADDRAVLVVTSGDRRVDEARVAAITGPLGRADAERGWRAWACGPRRVRRANRLAVDEAPDGRRADGAAVEAALWAEAED